MEFFVKSIICLIIAVFPLLLSTLYIIYARSLGKNERFLFIDITIIFTGYLLVVSQPKEIMLIASLPILIALLEKREITSICGAIILIFSYRSIFNFKIIYLILEYVIIILATIPYILKKISKYHIAIIYTILNLITFWIFIYIKQINTLEIEQIIRISLTFIGSVSIFMFLYDKCKESSKLFMSLKEIQESKQIKETLFKISHEIKNPLAVCKGYLDMYDYTNKEHNKKYVAIVKSEIEKTLILLQDFLNLTKTNLKKEIIDVNWLIEDCLDNIELLLTSNNIKVKKELVDDEIYINGDYNRLHQVFVNVIKNSVEAMEESEEKKILIRTTIISNYILIEIEDTGKGIDKELLKKIQEPFFTTKKNGTGLGVPLSIEIINAHGGKLEFKTQDNKGTIVKITLPLEF